MQQIDSRMRASMPASSVKFRKVGDHNLNNILRGTTKSGVVVDGACSWYQPASVETSGMVLHSHFCP